MTMLRLALAGGSALWLAACSTTPLPEAAIASSADDPAAPVRAVRYAPVMAGYEHRVPVSPRPWKDVNREQTTTEIPVVNTPAAASAPATEAAQ